MTLTTLRTLDQKNRLHIPCDYLVLADIDCNSVVTVSVDTVTGAISIRKCDLTDEQLNKLQMTK